MASPHAHARIRRRPDPATPRTTPMAKYRSAFKSSVVPVSRKGRTRASRTTKLAIAIKIRMTAARITSPPRIYTPNGRAIVSPPRLNHRKEEQAGNLSGAERRAQITPTGLCHSSTTLLLPIWTSARGHKIIRISGMRLRDGTCKMLRRPRGLRRTQRETARPTAPPPAPARTDAPPAPSSTGDVLAAPAVRRLAKELNVNLAAVRGSGPQGRLSEDDVRKAAHGPTRTTVVAPPPAAAVAPSGSEQRIPIHGLRKRIFEKIAKSNVTAAHFTYVEEVDMTQLVHLRDHLKPTADRKGVKLTFLPFFVKAILAALVEFPALNASVDDERGEIVVKGYYNIAIREMMYMSCSFDHRVVDGHVGAAFVQAVRNYLEHPATIFVETG